MRFTTFTNKGTAKLNTDAVARFIEGNVCAFVVVDGGEFCGDIVSPIIMNAIKTELKSNIKVNSTVIRDCFRRAVDSIKAKALEDEGFKNIKASGAMLITDGKKAVWGHIGNCRIYRLFRGKIKEVSQDHTLAYRDFMEKKISFEDIAKQDSFPPLVSINAENDVDADMSKVKKLFFKYSFILCSDGFWKNILPAEIENSAKMHDSTKMSLCQMIDYIEGHNISECDSASAIVLTI